MNTVTTTIGQPQSLNLSYALMDTGATSHFVPTELATPAIPSSPMSVAQPDGSILVSKLTTTLPFNHLALPATATTAHILSPLSNSLLSIGQLCDNDCIALFTKDKAHVLRGHESTQWLSHLPSHEVIMIGDRDTTDSLWHLPLHCQQSTPSNTQSCNASCNAILPLTTVAQHVAYYHACLGSPTLSTWCHAIDAGHLTTLPGLTTSQVRKHFPHSIATYMGHLDQTRQNQHSTKRHPIHSRDLYLGIFENIEAPSIPHRPGTIYSDPTGKFIVQSSQGNNYILVVFDTDSNYIFAEAMPSRTAHQILKAYEKIHTLLLARGITPSIHIMDNEISDLLKDYITQHKSTYQIVAPNQHRANAAERAIRTFKNHFISTLCTCDPNFPLHLWDRLLDQTIITLNLLRTSTINPKLSAYAQLHGTFDFAATPLGPPGTKVIVHEKPTQRGTWSPHGIEGWYVGPAMHHYRNFIVYIPSTRTTRITETLAWLPSKVIMPTASSSDIAIAAAYDLTQALLHPSPASALSPFTDSQRHALEQLASIFGNLVAPTDPPTDESTLAPLSSLTAHDIDTSHDELVAPTDPPTDESTIAPLSSLTEHDIDTSHDDPTVVTSNLGYPVHQTRETKSQPRVITTQPRVEVTQPRVDASLPRVAVSQPRVYISQPRVLVPQMDNNTIRTIPRGTRLSVYWPDDDQYYPGTITNITKRGRFHISYDDGDVETVDLTKELFKLLPSPASPPDAGSPTIDPLPSAPTSDPTPVDLSYTSYNHNGSQRRRQATTRPPKYNRRHRNPLNITTPPQPPSSEQLEPPTSPPSISVAASSSPSTPTTTLHRSSRGTKVARVDPRTHRLLPTHSIHAMAPPALIPYCKYAHDKIHLRQALIGPEGAIWERSTAKELGRLAQGLPGLVEGTNTMRFIHHNLKPADRIASYCRTVCAINLKKADTHRVRFTYGGDLSDYPYDVSTPTVDITTVKIHLNSVVSTPGAKYATFDLSNFYLNIPLERCEYMRIPINIIPQCIIDFYNLTPMIYNGYVMVEINKGIYGLPQAGNLAKRLLEQRLLQGGYYPAPHTPGLYLHNSRAISFTLWVDDFGVKYTDRRDFDHLTALLREHYEMTIAMSGTHYLGLTLHWNYKQRTVDLSMPGYIQRALERFQHPFPSKPQHSPHAAPPSFFGKEIPPSADPPISPPATPEQVKRLQEIIGVLLYYARMVDMTLLVSLSTIASQQSTATEDTMNAITHLLNYCATHPNAVVRFTRSEMILHIVSDASYLSASGARSRLGGYFFLSHPLSRTPSLPTDPVPASNGPILVNSSIIQAVVSSAAEAELGALFFNAKDGCMLRNTLHDLGHPQPATPIQADNACAVGLANDTMKQKRSKAIDMRFYWVRDRVKQGQFVIY